MMTKRRCWKVVFNINCDPAFQLSFLPTLSKPGFRLDISCTSRQELLERVEALRDAPSKMSPDQLKVHEITQDDCRVQITLI